VSKKKNTVKENAQELSASSSEHETHSNSCNHKNINRTERIASTAAGSAIALYGLKRGGISGLLLAAAGGSLVYRGASGQCQVYKALGINTSKRDDATSVHGDAGIKIEKSVTINKSPEELYQFWRNLENLPQFMNHLESVEVTDEKHSHWIAKAPAGRTVEWDAEIINDKENEMIAWRSLEGSKIPNAGSVHFVPAPEGRGTEVKVKLSYEPPVGKIGMLIAKFYGEEPGQQVSEDLRRFKQLMETGVTATIEGQPSGRASEAKEIKAVVAAATA
jgi:uncharacterized membrane protein